MTAKNPSRIKIKIPKEELNEFCQRYQIQRLALFGSVLGDDFHKESDVDVLISFRPNSKIGFIAFSRMQRELAELINRPVDLVPIDGIKPVIKESILANTEEIYAA